MPAQHKRWVGAAAAGLDSPRLLLARAVGEEQSSRIGNQTGGRAFLFLETDDLWRNFNACTARGVVFVRPQREEDNSYRLLDLTVYGRQEMWETSRPPGLGLKVRA